MNALPLLLKCIHTQDEHGLSPSSRVTSGGLCSELHLDFPEKASLLQALCTLRTPLNQTGFFQSWAQPASSCE